MFRIILVNTGSNVLVMLVKLTLTFIMTPFFIHYMGNYDYGLWEMVGAIVGYMGMLDLGIKPAISRFAAKYRAEDDRLGLQQVFASTFVFNVCIGFVVALILCGWALWFSGWMAPEGEESLKYALFLLIIAGQMLIVFPGYVAESFLEGFQKYYLKNNITILNSIIGAALFLTFANPENALLVLAGVNALGLSIKYLLFFVLLSRPSLGGISFKASNFTRSKLSEMLHFSLKSFVQGLATRMESATDTIVIGAVLGPASVPFYAIPMNLVKNIQGLGWTLTHAFMPLFSDMAARSRQAEIQSIYLVSSKVVAGLVVAIGVGVALVGTPFLALWIGPEYTEKSDIIILLLVIFVSLPMLNPFCSRYLTAINEHGIFAKLMPISAVINVGLSVVLVQYYGIVGVAVGSVLPALVLQPVLLTHSCRHLKLPVSQYLKTSLLPLMVPIISMGLFVAWVRWTLGIESYAALIATVVAGGTIYFIVFWFLSLTSDERQFVVSRFRR
ncbi:oligosaccharide flippase family protein [Marinobacter orientalis]|uniref:Polysaccharide biosynthesis protein n=1 Tax=Marinobacter orientalis TaxID=1928859 RepID=A0A7Y0RCM3_9GAMM|nr:oligosaccharide flippase family protein [Marinobacter orientalis]NMT63784.1 polysaccharide biosynthesis protein [Marinobacter orientalis]TGX49893.1 polysaccharide biosynthesis protein [Marinobacter orientalis]